MGQIILPDSVGTLQTKNSERMEAWTRKLNQQHFQSLCLISIGYADSDGTIDVQVPDGVSLADLKDVLQHVIASMPKPTSDEIKGLRTLNEAIKRNFKK